MNTIFKARAVIEKIILGVCVLLLFLIAFFIMLQVGARTLRISVNWTEEMARFSFVAVTFLGSVLAISKNHHIAITFLADMLPAKLRKILDIAICFIMAAFMVICVYGSSLIMAAAKGVRSNTVPWFHLNYVYGLVMISCGLMVVACLIRALELAYKQPDAIEEKKGDY